MKVLMLPVTSDLESNRLKVFREHVSFLSRKQE